MAYEKDLYEILEIQKEVEKLMERMNRFAMDIETDDTQKATKQVKALSKTTNKIVEHLSTLTTVEEYKAYLDKRTEDYNLQCIIQKVRFALKNNAIIDSISLGIYKITKEDIEKVCKFYDIDFTAGAHGDWSWLQFVKDDKPLTSDDLREIGLLI